MFITKADIDTAKIGDILSHHFESELNYVFLQFNRIKISHPELIEIAADPPCVSVTLESVTFKKLNQTGLWRKAGLWRCVEIR